MDAFTPAAVFGIVIGVLGLAATIGVARWQEKRRNNDRALQERRERDKRLAEKEGLTRHLEIIQSRLRQCLQSAERDTTSGIKAVTDEQYQQIRDLIDGLPAHIAAEVKEACRSVEPRTFPASVWKDRLSTAISRIQDVIRREGS